jgi:hypothetical protein
METKEYYSKKSDNELKILLEQYKQFEKTGALEDNELRKDIEKCVGGDDRLSFFHIIAQTVRTDILLEVAKRYFQKVN